MRKSAGQPRLRLRWDAIDGYQLRCPHCTEWWALTDEFWRMNTWDACIACIHERQRLYTAIKRANDTAYAQRNRDRARRYNQWLRANHPDLLRAYQREISAKHREKARGKAA